MLPIEHQNGFFNQFFYNVSEEPKSGNLTNMNLTNSTVKKIAIIFVVFLFACQAEKQASVKWVSSTFNNPWVNQLRIEADRDPKTSDIAVLAGNTFQQIEGFGTCFNELGWTSLSVLPDADREHIMQELFEPGKGANFTICRMPVAANDFSREWYSYDETDGDFAMTNFSVDNDRETLIPFIKNAQKYRPGLAIWASPWCPPSWMKYNKHYASASSLRMADMARKYAEQRIAAGDTSALGGFFANVLDPQYQNDLPLDRQGAEGTDMFIQEDKYLQAYALYFSKFIDAYRAEGVDIFAVMPQNEFNSAQVFPSCCWTAAGLAGFIGNYLGPAMQEKGVEVIFGTMERPTEALVDTILTDAEASRYVSGVGFQWAGKDALPGISKRYPNLKIFQTEQECGDGKNDWQGAMHSWELMKHYLGHGVSVYEYWNTSLLKGGISRWGWAQNSLVVVDGDQKSYEFTPEYYVMKHVSHFVQPGAYRIETTGDYDDLLAFKNPDESIVLVVANQSDEERKVSFQVAGKAYSPVLPANSINTVLVEK